MCVCVCVCVCVCRSLFAILVSIELELWSLLKYLMSPLQRSFISSPTWRMSSSLVGLLIMKPLTLRLVSPDILPWFCFRGNPICIILEVT